jgi:hypothetical protein
MGSSIKDFMGRIINKHNIRQLRSDRNYWIQDCRKADKKIKHCPRCNKCWETYKEQRGINNKSRKRKVYLNMYKDFPAYGKEKAICPMCQN